MKFFWGNEQFHGNEKTRHGGIVILECSVGHWEGNWWTRETWESRGWNEDRWERNPNIWDEDKIYDFMCDCFSLFSKYPIKIWAMLTPWVMKMRWDCFVVENVENSTRGLRHLALHPFIFFEIIRVTENCKDRTQKCCVLFAQLSQMFIFYITVVKSQNQQVHNTTMCIYFFVILSREYLCS